MKKIIIISGKQYSGKDTLANILLEKMPSFKRIGIGDAIKIEYAKKHFLSIDEILKNKHLYREGLIELGNWGRMQSDSYWLDNLSMMDNIIVPDVRMPFELEYFKKLGAFLVRVESSEINRSKRGVLVKSDDETETALDNYSNWNIIIENNSDYEALKTKADYVFAVIKKYFNI